LAITRDRLRKIEELYHAVRESPSDRRAALLAAADPEVRNEVQSLLLAAQDKTLPALDVRPMAVIQPGTRLGPYLVESKLGEGGMGEVFKARDTRLGRLVAVKVMPKYIASREDLRARFEREARTVSSLNHPNICALYDFGKQDGTDFMVLEYLEGETVAERIAKGPLPLDQALKFAMQIADALDRAHRSGVSHRDVKPANVIITRDGCKVLDFGLAKTTPKPIAQDDATLTARLTAEGTIMGTPQYMAPEQYEGKEADARSDIFAFGCVVYEMVTGKRCFNGKTRASLIAAVMGSEPPSMSALAPVTPAALERLVKRCLEKDPEDRYQSMRDVVLDLRSAGQPGNLPAQTTGLRHRGILMTVAIGAFAIGGSAFWWLKPAPPVTRVVTRFSYTLPEGQNVPDSAGHTIALSPDGTKLAYVANQQLYLRAMDQLEAQPIRGTNEDPVEPVFSPDGQWLAYFVPAGGAGAARGPFVLTKIAVAGGAPVALGQVAGAPNGATWRDETIAFGINREGVASIQAMPDAGGTLRTIVKGDPGKERLMQPQLLADRTHLMFVSVPRTTVAGSEASEGQIVVQALDGKDDGKDRRTLVAAGTDPRVLAAGQLAYIHDGTLLAVPFDTGSLTVTGGPVSVLEGVTETVAGQFAVSPDGTLAFRPGGVSGGKRLLVWVDRDGHEQPISAKARIYVYPRISPDGTKIAVSSADEEDDVWVFDLARETLTRLTFGPAFELYATWTPDSKHVLFSSGAVSPAGAATPLDIFRKIADGTVPAGALTRQFSGGYPQSESPDGKSLVFRRYFANPSSNSGLYLLPLDPTGEPRALLADPKFNEVNGEISPDGHWIAYDSNESGRPEVYVRPFPAVDSGRWQISSEGGAKPFWSRSGRELFFMSRPSRLFVAPVTTGTTFTYGKPQSLLDAGRYVAAAGRTVDISPDGKRFLMVKNADSSGPAARPSIVIVSHWFDEVKAKMGNKR
jgi:Tol biopolymer transport system component